MFGFLRKLFKKNASPSAHSPPEAIAGEAAAPAEVSAYSAPDIQMPQTSAEYVDLALKPIIAAMPKVLQDSVTRQPGSEVHIKLPLQFVACQLARGLVRITLGDLKKLCPAGLFSPSIRWDAELVSLPLQQIIPKLPPNLLTRRSDQQVIHVPDEIVVVFGHRQAQTGKQKRRGGAAVPAEKHAPAPPPPPALAVPESRSPATAPSLHQPLAAPHSPAPSVPRLPSGLTVPAAPSPSLTVPQPTQPARPSAPSAMPSAGPAYPLPASGLPAEPALPKPPTPITPQTPLPATGESIPGKIAPAFQQHFGTAPYAPPSAGAVRSPSVIAPKPEAKLAPSPLPAVPQPAALPGTQPSISLPKTGAPTAAPPSGLPPATPLSVPSPIPLSRMMEKSVAPPPPEAPRPAAAGAVSLAQEPGKMVVALQTLAEAWPENIRQELNQLNAVQGALAAPCEMFETPIKQGKLQFTWNQIRNWIRPPVPAGSSSPHGDQKLDLPLAVFVPLFLAQGKLSRVGRQASIPENIPDLFARPVVATPTPAAAPPTQPSPPAIPAASAAQASTPSAPAPSREPAPISAAPEGSVSDIGEVFGQPGKRHWTPAEIVQKTASLPGVEGSLIAMQDGLLVANQLPPNLNGEMIAAFLPQMFGRMSHYTAELKLGEPSSLLLMVNQAPLKISRVGRVFYTVLGKPGQPLPETVIAAVVVQLDRQAKQL